MIYKLNKKNIEIRQANLDDIKQIMPIECISFGKHHWSEKSFKDELMNNYSFYLVAVDKPIEKIVGYIGYWLIHDEGHITTLAVDPFYREGHIADILLYNLIQHALTNNINWLTLEVRTSNQPAINLYSKYKFKICGIRKKYYQDNNEDALVLWTDNINDKTFKLGMEGVIEEIARLENNADKLQYATS